MSKSTAFNPKNFVHLHNHTHYSLLDGLQKVPEMVERVKALGMEAVAITDHGTLSGSIEFYKTAQAAGVKPIIGIETYIAPRKHTDKEGKQDANPYHLILLAMNKTGYQNLMHLSSIAHLEGFYYKPRIDHALLEKYNEGLIVLSACINGEVGDALRSGRDAEARKAVVWYKEIFGDRYYLEIQDHGHQWEEQAKVNAAILKLGDELGIPVVVTADAHYCNPKDQEAHEVLLCVQTGSQLSDEKRMSLKDTQLFVSDPSEIAKRWVKRPDVLHNTRAVAERCDLEIEFGKMLIPKFKTPGGLSEKEYLERLAYQGLAWRYGKVLTVDKSRLEVKKAKALVKADVCKRLEYELGVINSMGFASYFLIVADFINWGKNQGIVFGPGRGSTAGSIVAYCLGITELDPLAYDLLFERFLNPDRISMPDADIDIQDTRRDEVIGYVSQKYGADRVANIVTFGKMAARNAIRDTARVLGVSYGDADRLAKMVPPPIQGRHIPLAKCIEDSADLAREYVENPQSKRVIDLAMRLEGTIRSHGVHAAGVVIAPDEIVKYTPLEKAQKGVVATQYSGGPIEDIGLLKMDFLGLSNLTVINNALRIIRKVYEADIDITAIPLNNQKTFGLLARGDTTGVFQLESAGMKRFLRELNPNQFEDIIAMVSLYRPGPMAELPRYIAAKNDSTKITYPHESLEPILKNTYGVMVYQEQIIAMLQLIAGYSAGEADLVRKAIGKKKRDIMAAEQPKFIKGCAQQGLSKKQAENLWTLLQPFADYSFNKSHAACYGLIAYQTAYLKAHYPAAFMAALMTSDFENTERIAIEIAECRHMGIEVLAPDINESFVEFAVRREGGSKTGIRFGMSAIKNVGVGAVEEILRIREDGSFASVEDFARRVPVKFTNRKVWEALIKAGAFDALNDRAQLLYNLDHIVAFAQKIQKNAVNGQTDLFGDSVIEAGLAPSLHLEQPAEEVSERERLTWERELLGVYLSSHPLENLEAYLADKALPLSKITAKQEGANVQIGGLVTAVRVITTRNGSQMAFVKLEDTTGELEVIVFPKTYESFKPLWEIDKVLLIQGKISSKDRDGQNSQETKIMADKVRGMSEQEVKEALPPAQLDSADVDAADGFLETGSSPATGPADDSQPVIGVRTLEITLAADCRPQTLMSIKKLLDQNDGQDLTLIISGDQRIKLPFQVAAIPELTARLKKLPEVSAVDIR